jgi:putative MATE family efflux protein
VRNLNRHITADRDIGGLESRRRLILTGKVLPTLLILVWPFILQVILQMGTRFIDTWMIGQYGQMNGLGPDPLAAIGLANNAMMIIHSLAMGTGIGLSVLVAQYTGRGDHRRAVTVAIDAFWFLAVFSLVIVVLGNFLLDDFITVYNSSERVNGYVYDYLIVLVNGMFVVLLSLVVFNIMQATGDTLTPTIILAIINVINIALNWLLIPGPAVFGLDPAQLGLGMGIKGAAVGTLAARFAGCAMAIGLMVSGRYRIDMRGAERFSPKWAGTWSILRIGLPSAFQFVSRNLSVLALNLIISFSFIREKAHAALNTGFLIEWLPFGPAMALMQASAIIIGQNIGAGQKKRAERAGHTAFAFAVIVMSLNAIVFWYWPEMLAKIFTNDRDVIISLAAYLKIMGIGDIFLASLIYAGGIRAAGDATTPMLANFFALWVLRIPAAWFLMKFLDYYGVWLAMGFSQVIQGMVLYGLFRHGQWKKIDLIGREAEGA